MKPCYRIQTNIGKAKYLVSYHDGAKQHEDGSPFFGIEILSNKRKLAAFVRDLKARGYVEATLG